jgi:hypothetical protein
MEVLMKPHALKEAVAAKAIRPHTTSKASTLVPVKHVL